MEIRVTDSNKKPLDRREFLRQSAITAVTAVALGSGSGSQKLYAGQTGGAKHGKVIIIGIDGMDPRLTERMMQAGQLPNLNKLRSKGGYSRLGTSTPPQSPVAWATFINGAGPGSHGIFDFIHRNPERQCAPFYSAAETVGGSGYWEVGDHRVQLNFWPFSHKSPKTLLQRKGTPFWDYLDEAAISSTFYDLPANYPPSPSKHGNHRCLSGMGTPDMLGTYGTYQHFAENGPIRTKNEGGGKRSMVFFENETSKPPLKLIGPADNFLKKSKPTEVEFLVHRDTEARAAVIEIQDQRIVLEEGQWSRWVKIDFELSMPALMPNKHISGICRFFLQEVGPNFRLYITPVNIDPSEPAMVITQPPKFIEQVSDKLGLFYTAGFQEDHKALSNKVFTEDEFAAQADLVLQERLNLLEYAMNDFDDGLLFFYFSSTDLQAHMFWWDSDDKHPIRSRDMAKKYFEHFKGLYKKMDDVVGDVIERYGDSATVIVMSDHGFANFKRQFNLNTWLRDNGYLGPANCKALLGSDVDWSQTRAYGLGINGLYLNLKGRERDGIVRPGPEQEHLIAELIEKLEAVRDVDGKPVIRKVHRSDKTYSGPATALAPDLIVGYYRGYRASWDTCLGNMSETVLSDNESAWSADHCADASQVPGVIFSNRPIKTAAPSLVDIAPSVLTKFGLKVPATMTGRDLFSTT